MPRDTNIPDAFDVYTVVVLRRPADAPEMSDEELDALQARHLAYRAELRRQGVVVANGPFDEQSDPSYRGMSIFACDAAEAARLSDGDPSVVAGTACLRRDGVVGQRRLARLPAHRPPGRRPPLDARRLASSCRRS